MKVKIKQLHSEARQPTYSTDGSGCFDIYACDPGYVAAGSPSLISTGLAFEIPEGHVMLVFSRSGHGIRHATRLANCVGVIDSDYRGELMIKLTRELLDTSSCLLVNVGDRVAQAMIIPVERASFEFVDELSATARGEGAFGSTGA